MFISRRTLFAFDLIGEANTVPEKESVGQALKRDAWSGHMSSNEQSDVRTLEMSKAWKSPFH